MTTTLTFKRRTSQKRRKAVAEHLRKGYSRVRLNPDSLTLTHKKSSVRVIWTFMLTDCFATIKSP